MAINPAGGYVSIGNNVQDGLLTIGGNSDATSIPSIRLLDGSDTREVSISNQSGDLIMSTHGTDDAAHGSMKIYDSGIIALSTDSGAGNADENGRGAFKYSPPSGYLSLCSANLQISDDIDPAGDDGGTEAGEASQQGAAEASKEDEDRRRARQGRIRTGAVGSDQY